MRSSTSASPDDVIDPHTIEVVAPNFSRRLSGVTTTIVHLVPQMRADGLAVAACGPGLPDNVARIPVSGLWRLWRSPPARPWRIWHARRNVEMIVGLILRDVLRMPLKVMFTAEAQRHPKRFTRWLTGRMDALVTTNARSAAYIGRSYQIVPHGVDALAYHPPAGPEDLWAASGLPGKHGIGCFGRVRAQKGTDLFVDAMIALLPDHPEWTAVISGRVTPEHQGFADGLKARIAAAGLESRIVFIGEVEDIRVWYRRLSLYVAPSRNEGFGLTPLEAMASGKPVVASDAGAYAEMIDPGHTGAVAPAGDGAALREAIRPYLADPDLAVRHGATALATLNERFSLQAEAAGLRRIYERLWGAR